MCVRVWGVYVGSGLCDEDLFAVCVGASVSYKYTYTITHLLQYAIHGIERVTDASGENCELVIFM